MILEVYQTAEKYLAVTKHVLLERELENNLVLGICNQLDDQHLMNKNYQFFTVLEESEPVTSAINTPAKIVFASMEVKQEAIKSLAQHVAKHLTKAKGVVGPLNIIETFIELLPLTVVRQKTLCLYGLSKLQQRPVAEGEFVRAAIHQREILIEWCIQFYKEIDLFPKKSEHAIRKLVNLLIETNSLFCWIKKGVPMSMAAVIRRTDNIAIIGMVYTPKQERGKNYALNCVEKLSEHIFELGYNYCGLFTDKDYPISNKIYQKIGYEKVSDFLDVEFS